MANHDLDGRDLQPQEATLRWLLDSDPAIRWQVMRDLSKEPGEIVAAERSRVAMKGWGAELLDRQRPDGKWGDDIEFPQWTSTLHTMVLLREFGLDPADERARVAVARVRDQVTWGPEFGDSPFFDGEVEPCINGAVLALGSYFGEASDRLADRLLGEQLGDGGWNCEAEQGSTRSSFHTTIRVLEGLLAYEQAKGADPRTTEARTRAQNYLLERHLFKRLSTGEVIDPAWTQLHFPTTWHYDILRGLDYFRSADFKPDERMAEAIGRVARRQHPDGRWPLAKPYSDPAQLAMEGSEGKPSRWVTHRALRVLIWYSGQANDAGAR